MKIIRFLKTDVKIINSYFLIAVILIILISVGYFSYALFSFTKTSNNVIEGTVGELKKSGADTLIKLTNNQNDSGLYTITHSADSTLQIGATESVTEYRYRGASPKNYVTFNNEVWRIIGIFPTDDGNGNIENRIKLIRNESIAPQKWNTTKVSSTSTYNNWTGATLQIYLNGDYYNSLIDTSQSMISSLKYYLGGHASYLIDTSQMYKNERKINGGTYYYGTNPNNWIGKIGLMYLSDYGYASANCEGKVTYDTQSSSNDLRACNDTNWLYNLKVNEWLLPQYSEAGSGSYYSFFVYSDGHVYPRDVRSSQSAVRPTLYLKSNVKITGGDGTSSSPYTLGL